MGNYILSDANRFYAAREIAYGIPASVSSSDRLAAFQCEFFQAVEIYKRRDKTGSRTFLGSSTPGIRHSRFDVKCHLVSWDSSSEPGCGPLVQAAMGADPELFKGLVVANVTGAKIQIGAATDLRVGSAISNGTEIRFVVGVEDSSTFTLNAPFAAQPGVGSTLAPVIQYGLAKQLTSVSIYDFWAPTGSVNRLVTGAVVEKFVVTVKGGTHELGFSGPAADVLDSCSQTFGESGLSEFPAEPAISTFDYAIVDGSLGQVWLGAPMNQVFALTEANIEVNNNLQVRDQEFGSSLPKAIVPGPREIVCTFRLFAQSDAASQSLYAAAKRKTPISALLQLGQEKGQMMAVYLPNVISQVPIFSDSEPYLLWEFKNNFGEGLSNDEAYIAFA